MQRNAASIKNDSACSFSERNTEQKLQLWLRWIIKDKYWFTRAANGVVEFALLEMRTPLRKLLIVSECA